MSIVTLKEIAEKVGISESTASRALRNHPDVSKETQAKVTQVAEELGYFPSLQARGLASGSSSIVGLLVSDLSNPFYPYLARRIEQEAQSEGYSIMLCQTGDDPEQSLNAIQRLLSYRVAGIIHASVCLEDSSLDIVRKAGIPLVITNRRPDEKENDPQVLPNYIEGAKQATSHLLSSSRSEILHFGGPDYASSSVDVAAGFRKAFEEYDMELREDSIITGTFRMRNGRERTEHLIASGALPDAIFAVNDYVALGAMDALLREGIRIPEDVAIVGFDNIPLAYFPTIQLSSVDLDSDEVAATAWQQLHGRMSGDEIQLRQTIVFKPKLIIRRSSAAP